MSKDTNLICAYLLDGEGGGRSLGWPEIQAWKPEDGVLWVHLDRKGAETRKWLEDQSGVDPIVGQALLEEDVRPRILPVGCGLLVVLRGVNLNPGADPSDMVGLRLLIEERRVISLRHARLMAVNDVREALERGDGAKNPGDLLVTAAGGLVERMGPVIADIDDEIDTLEEQVLTSHSTELRSALAEVRQQAIALRRYLAPQRDVVSRLPLERVEWLDDMQRALLREVAERTTRYVEDLDSGRERAQVVQDELNNRLADRMNRTMYLLTVVSAVLLPPSLLTGLLGINVGGMPGVESPWAFAIVAVAIVAVAVVEVVLLRRLRWI